MRSQRSHLINNRPTWLAPTASLDWCQPGGLAGLQSMFEGNSPTAQSRRRERSATKWGSAGVNPSGPCPGFYALAYPGECLTPPTPPSSCQNPTFGFWHNISKTGVKHESYPHVHFFLSNPPCGKTAPCACFFFAKPVSTGIMQLMQIQAPQMLFFFLKTQLCGKTATRIYQLYECMFFF